MIFCFKDGTYQLIGSRFAESTPLTMRFPRRRCSRPPLSKYIPSLTRFSDRRRAPNLISHCFCSILLNFRSWPWPRCCCNPLHWPSKHKSWKIPTIAWATICFHLLQSWASLFAFSSSCPTAFWFTEPKKWENRTPKKPQFQMASDVWFDLFCSVFVSFHFIFGGLCDQNDGKTYIQESTREVSVWLAINLCTIIYVLLIIVFVYDLLVGHETYMEFANVCILELILFSIDGKRSLA